jgi:hypothetical protein
MLKALPAVLNIAVADPNGNLYCSALSFKGPINVADRAYFKMAIQLRGFTIGDYQIGRITKLPAINYAYPLTDPSGDLQGVVYVAQSLDWLTTALANVAFPPGPFSIPTARHGARAAARCGRLTAMLPEAKAETQPEGGGSSKPTTRGKPLSHAPLIAGLDLHATIGTSGPSRSPTSIGG